MAYVVKADVIDGDEVQCSLEFYGHDEAQANRRFEDFLGGCEALQQAEEEGALELDGEEIGESELPVLETEEEEGEPEAIDVEVDEES